MLRPRKRCGGHRSLYSSTLYTTAWKAHLACPTHHTPLTTSNIRSESVWHGVLSVSGVSKLYSSRIPVWSALVDRQRQGRRGGVWTGLEPGSRFGTPGSKFGTRLEPVWNLFKQLTLSTSVENGTYIASWWWCILIILIVKVLNNRLECAIWIQDAYKPIKMTFL